MATFDEDVDVTTATIAGGRTWAENLNVWREQRVSMKSRTKETAGVYLGWEVEADDEGDEGEGAGDDEGEGAGDHEGEGAGDDEGEAGDDDEERADVTPRYVIGLPAGFTVDPSGVLFFSLADANESSSKPAHLRDNEEQSDEQQGGEQQNEDQQQNNEDDSNDENDDEDENEDEPREPIDFTVRFVDANGVVAELPLSRFSTVQPQLEVQLRKALFDEPRTESEAVFQSFLFPLEWFLEANPELDASRPARLEFVFDRSPSGVVILDTIGFRPSPGL